MRAVRDCLVKLHRKGGKGGKLGDGEAWPQECHVLAFPTNLGTSTAHCMPLYRLTGAHVAEGASLQA